MYDDYGDHIVRWKFLLLAGRNEVKIIISSVDKDDRYLVVKDNITTLYIFESSIYSVWPTSNVESFLRVTR